MEKTSHGCCVNTCSHAQTSSIEISLQAVVSTGDNLADDLTPVGTVDTGIGGTVTLSNSDVGDGMSIQMNVTVSPPQSVPITLSWTNTDNIDSGPSSPHIVQALDSGTVAIYLGTDDLPDNSDANAIATFTATTPGVTANAVVTLDFS